MIRIGGSVGGRFSRPIAGITAYENRILQNGEHKYFWSDSKFCINNSIYLIVNIDTYQTGSRWRPSNQELRDFTQKTKYGLRQIGANKTNTRFTADNESDEYTDFNSYMNIVRVIHDALAGEFDLGAGNFRTQSKDWYEALAKRYYLREYEVFDFHMQDGLNSATDISMYVQWISYLKGKYGVKRCAVTEGNNFWDVTTLRGHNMVKCQINYAESIGAEDFCFPYVNWMHNGEESDNGMSYNLNYNPKSEYWQDMVNFINDKRPKELVDMIELNLVKPGSRNEETRAVQQIMLDEGYDLSPYGADGIYGKITEVAIKKWQADNNLKVDGIVGRETWQWILGNIESGVVRFLQLLARIAKYK